MPSPDELCFKLMPDDLVPGYVTPKLFMNSWLYDRTGAPLPFMVLAPPFPVGVSRSNDQNRVVGRPLDLTKALIVPMSCKLVTSSWVSARPMSWVRPIWLKGMPDCWLSACAAAIADCPISQRLFTTTQLLVLVEP